MIFTTRCREERTFSRPITTWQVPGDVVICLTIVVTNGVVVGREGEEYDQEDIDNIWRYFRLSQLE